MILLFVDDITAENQRELPVNRPPPIEQEALRAIRSAVLPGIVQGQIDRLLVVIAESDIQPAS